MIKAVIKDLGEFSIPDQPIGNTKLNVMPFTHDGSYVKLPIEYNRWEKHLNKMLEYVPVQEDAQQHYITINSEFFTESGQQRREGIHIDGNFCVDPTFVGDNHEILASWGGASPSPTLPTWSGILPKDHELSLGWGVKPTWGKASAQSYVEKPDNSHVKMDWVLPYDIVIPIAKYVSNDKGGMFIASSDIGTKAWEGEFHGKVAAEGSFKNMEDQCTESNMKFIPKNNLFFMTSTTPHESLHIPAGTRRTFMRLTLNHNYNNKAILVA